MRTVAIEIIRRILARGKNDSATSLPANLLIIGDSISNHYRVYLESYLKGEIQCLSETGVSTTSAILESPQGFSWGDSSTVLNRLRKGYLNQHMHVDWALVNCGLHDIRRQATGQECQVPLRRYRENLRAIIGIFARTNTRMVWVSSTPVCDERHNSLMKDFKRFNRDCVSYNASARKIMRKFGVPVIDLYEFSEKLGADLYCDHIHFDETIQKLQAAYIAGWLYGHAQKHQRTASS